MAVDLLEREGLLGELRAARAGVGDRGAIVLVAGEAGIGKSSLVRAFLASVPQGQVALGLCDPLLTPRALGPVHDIARVTGGALARRLGDGSAREAVFGALLDVIDAGSPGQSGEGAGGPRVLVVEDVHWADEATLDLLVFLGRRWERLPALLVLTYREDELGDEHPLLGVLASLPRHLVRVLRPAPLSVQATAELAASHGRPAGELHAVTGGNPLLVTEAVAAGDGLVTRTVSDLVLARLGALEGEARDVCRLAAVVPGALELSVLERALHPSSTSLEAVVSGGLLLLDGVSVRYRHELLRRAAEASLSPLRRRELNRRVLQVLVSGLTDAGDGSSAPPGVDPARLVHHAREAQDGAAVLRWGAQAGQRAAALGAHREAVEHFAAALVHAGALPDRERAELLEAHARQAYLAADMDGALRSYEQALALREGIGQALHIGADLRWLSRVLWWIGRQDEAFAAATRAVEVLQALPPGRELAMAFSTLSQLVMLNHRAVEAVEWGGRALAVARALEDPESTSHALTNIGTAHLQMGEPEGGDELEQAFTVALEADLAEHAARALVNLAYTSLEKGDYARSGVALERALRFASSRDLEGYASYLRGTRAWWRLDQGDWTGAQADARAVLDGRVHPGVSILPALITLARLQSRRGDPAAAATLDVLVQRAGGTQELQRVGPVAAARAEHARLRGDTDAAAQAAGPALRSAIELRHPWMAGELAWELRQAGVDTPVPDWLAEPYALLLGGNWHGAAQAWEARGCVYLQAEALAAGDEREGLLRALSIFDQLRAAPAARRVRARLATMGGVPVPRGPQPSTVANPAQLTSRQLDVLRRMAAGSSNADIAADLTLSVRTVDHHVSAVLAKLAVGSRREAVAAAAALGIELVQPG